MSDREVELADMESIIECVDDLRELLKEGSTAERRTFIRGLVKEVKGESRTPPEIQLICFV